LKTKIQLTLIFIPMLILAGFIVWGTHPLPAQAEALIAMRSTSTVSVYQDHLGYIFMPSNKIKEIGVIFYPGGHVDPRAYAPILRNISNNGYPVILVSMPLNLALLGKDKANEVIKNYPEIRSWVLVGHSLGGAMAAQYADQHIDQLSGLVLMASYPPKNTRLQNSQIKVLSIYGELDGITTLDEIDQSRQSLPNDSIFQQINGGNHAQFGSYGWQNGDLTAEILAAEQQDIASTAVLNFLNLIQ